MSNIHPISSRPINFKSNNNLSTQKYEYPFTYEEYKTKKLVSSVTGSMIIGGITFLIAKAKRFDCTNKKALIIASSVTGFLAVSNIISASTGRLKEQYMNSKMRFTEKSLSIALREQALEKKLKE